MFKLKYTSVVASLIMAMGSAPFSLAGEQPDPYAKADDTWISISGEVKSVSPNNFILDYGEGIVLVEMDDGDRDADAYKLLEGDKVTVNGMIDDDFYEATTIEADSVYVEKLNTYFFASAVDEEDKAIWYTFPIVPGEMTVQGTVTQVNGDEFNVNAGVKSVTVDVSDMPYNPLDNKGYQKIEKGDVVRVTGNMEDKLFQGRELEAQTALVLVD